MKNIECHYKDGSLVFCTTHCYPYAKAHKILDVFNVMGLVSRIRLKSGQSFNVIGRLPVNYDPFIPDQGKWTDVVSRLVETKQALENEVQAI
ncbi:hypothetical protein [Dyadobacter aurulentus]|uniref:hypothetical protein n=1 Tax=Dyadobacter sp. UC 10 TaxID=2605428 RepID=UPI0011F0D759|nr:hypothetical protein [Dyadobacter sp. UC 10]KAA0993117.1 hypothetical protein FXO21_24550 [Dyadobacter sp. UC 10]